MNAVFPDAPPRWRLDELYGGRDDPRIEADFANAEKAAHDLSALEGALLAARAQPAALAALLARGAGLCEAVQARLARIAAYAGMAASADTLDPAWARFESAVRERAAPIEAASTAFTLELNRLDDGEFAAALEAEPSAAHWAPWFRRLRLGRAHELSLDLERLLIDRAPAVANWVRLHEETLAQLAPRVGTERLSLAEALNRLADPVPARRRAAGRALAQALAEKTPVLALAWNTLAAEKQVEDRWRRFDDPAAARHLANEIDPAVVAALEGAVIDALPRLSHRYYRLKARALGRRALGWWDRSAPLDGRPARKVAWREACALVLDAFAEVSPRFADIAAGMLASRRIDAEPRPGKQSGAYSHPVADGAHPFVFLNFMGERRDVLTLAHELGHAVHQSLASPHGVLLSETPLTLAETASIFGEAVVFERLLADAAPAERRGLLAGRIEDALDTVVRQIAFHRFETRFHAARRRGELSAEEIGALWIETMAESLGPAVRLGRFYETMWAYIGHFVHTPFYVYSYAFGQLLAEALFAVRAADPAAFALRYEALLAAGGTLPWREALSPFGLDPSQKAFWAAGCARVERMIDAFEALAA